MVEDDVITVVEGERTLFLVDALSTSHANVSDDDVLAVRGDDAATINGDALSGSCLSGNGDIALDGDAGVGDIDDTAYVEDYDTVGLADGIGQRSCTRRIEIGDMHDFSSTTAGGIGCEALCTREGWLLCAQRLYRQEQKRRKGENCFLHNLYVRCIVV